MECTLEAQENAIIVHVDGRVDESTWEAFSACLSQAIAQAGKAGLPTVIIDLSELEYMSSRGLRVLTVAKRESDSCGIATELASPNEVMAEILAISRYDKLFTITGGASAKP